MDLDLEEKKKYAEPAPPHPVNIFCLYCELNRNDKTRPVAGELSVGAGVGGQVGLELVRLLVDGDVVVDPLVVIVHGH